GAAEHAASSVRTAPVSGGGRPAFEIVTQSAHTPGDQASWQTEGPASGRF
ncbi:MAG: hypothetical protein HOE85_14995, partial [Nitrospinaceae bacterium]|nr:hypothetical protein [Nitrospinaceae bacterium]